MKTVRSLPYLYKWKRRNVLFNSMVTVIRDNVVIRACSEGQDTRTQVPGFPFVLCLQLQDYVTTVQFEETRPNSPPLPWPPGIVSTQQSSHVCRRSCVKSTSRIVMTTTLNLLLKKLIGDSPDVIQVMILVHQAKNRGKASQDRVKTSEEQNPPTRLFWSRRRKRMQRFNGYNNQREVEHMLSLPMMRRSVRNRHGTTGTSLIFVVRLHSFKTTSSLIQNHLSRRWFYYTESQKERVKGKNVTMNYMHSEVNHFDWHSTHSVSQESTDQGTSFITIDDETINKS